jgi:hypothetical protein
MSEPSLFRIHPRPWRFGEHGFVRMILDANGSEVSLSDITIGYRTSMGLGPQLLAIVNECDNPDVLVELRRCRVNNAWLRLWLVAALIGGWFIGAVFF